MVHEEWLLDEPDVMRHWQSGAPVQKDLEYFIVVHVGCLCQRRNVRRERRRRRFHRFPGLQIRGRKR